MKLSEDWQATIIGLLLVVIIGLGLLGPGPHKVTMTATAGETVNTGIDALGGWSVSVKVNGETVDTSEFPDDINDNQIVVFACADGVVTAESIEDSTVSMDTAQLTLINNCDAEVEVKYEIKATVQWPLFRVFE